MGGEHRVTDEHPSSYTAYLDQTTLVRLHRMTVRAPHLTLCQSSLLAGRFPEGAPEVSCQRSEGECMPHDRSGSDDMRRPRVVRSWAPRRESGRGHTLGHACGAAVACGERVAMRGRDYMGLTKDRVATAQAPSLNCRRRFGLPETGLRTGPPDSRRWSRTGACHTPSVMSNVCS
jgi:hypothetical protein